MSEQVKSERFATVQRDGYDPAAVDEVIGNLEQAVHDLTAKCAGLEQADMAMRAILQTANERVRLQEEELARALDTAREPAPVRPPVPVDEDPVRATSEWAARLLEISTREAETIVTEARDEAGRIVARARSEAAQTIQARLSKLHAREDAVEEMAEEQRKQLDRMRNETLLELEGRRDELDAEVRRSTEVRTQLVSYFHEQLEFLERPRLLEVSVGAHLGESRAS
jgi:cell division septum initiation protein DivIVA